METVEIKKRWKNNFQVYGDDFFPFWQKFLNERKRNLLLISGLGFDPRTTLAIEQIIQAGGEGDRKAFVLDFVKNEQENTGRYKNLVSDNQENLKKILGDVDYEIKRIIMRSLENHNIGGRNVTKIIGSDTIQSYTDIIIDISAMPRGIFFPLISKAIALIDKVDNTVNLHVVVSENSKLDADIKTEGLAERASFIHGFGNVEVEKYENLPKVWVPVLGENKLEQIKILRENISPHETCPILPFPSVDIRRGDKLLTEYKSIFLDDLSIEMRDITYVDEQNAFQAYRTILDIIMRYQKSFSLFDGCKTIISVLSSKLLSIGALLAAFELKKHKKVIGVLHVDSEDFNFTLSNEQVLNDSTLYNIWITGEPYEE